MRRKSQIEHVGAGENLDAGDLKLYLACGEFRVHCLGGSGDDFTLDRHHALKSKVGELLESGGTGIAHELDDSRCVAASRVSQVSEQKTAVVSFGCEPSCDSNGSTDVLRTQ